jgi:hypothetical protein
MADFIRDDAVTTSGRSRGVGAARAAVLFRERLGAAVVEFVGGGRVRG